MSIYVMQVVRESGTYNYVFQPFGAETPEQVAAHYAKDMDGEVVGVLPIEEFLDDSLMEICTT